MGFDRMNWIKLRGKYGWNALNETCWLRTEFKLSPFLAGLLQVTRLDGLLAVRVKPNWDVVKELIELFGWLTGIGDLSDVVKSVLTLSTRLRLEYFLKHS